MNPHRIDLRPVQEITPKVAKMLVDMEELGLTIRWYTKDQVSVNGIVSETIEVQLRTRGYQLVKTSVTSQWFCF